MSMKRQMLVFSQGRMAFYVRWEFKCLYCADGKLLWEKFFKDFFDIFEIFFHNIFFINLIENVLFEK